MSLLYYHVDVFICMECQRMEAHKQGTVYLPGQIVPHCNCTGTQVKMAYLGHMPKSTWLKRRKQIERNWDRFNGRLPQGKNRNMARLSEETVRAVYDLNVM